MKHSTVQGVLTLGSLMSSIWVSASPTGYATSRAISYAQPTEHAIILVRGLESRDATVTIHCAGLEGALPSVTPIYRDVAGLILWCALPDHSVTTVTIAQETGPVFTEIVTDGYMVSLTVMTTTTAPWTVTSYDVATSTP